MPLNPRRLRRWFAAGAVCAIAISLAYYLYARLREIRSAQHVASALGIEVQQSTQGFTLSKSESGRTIFTVHASRAVQYKAGGRAELHNVSILIYGRRADRFDQISGDHFEYDPNSGDIIAHGEVAIDLEGNAQGPVRADQAAPVELKNPVHLKTSGLVFNQKTGAAATREKVEFRIPQASGSAVGAAYDSKANMLTLASQVVVQTQSGAIVLARHAIITQNPRQAVLQQARIQRPAADIDASRLTLYLREDNTVSRMVADGGVHGISHAVNTAQVAADHGDFLLGPKSELLSGVLSGAVKFLQEGPSPLNGSAARAALTFGPRNVLSHITATEDVRFAQQQRAAEKQAAQTVELASDALDLFLNASRLDHGVTGGAARISIRPQAPTATQGNTVITAGRFEMSFAADSRLHSLHGEPEARIVNAPPGQPEKISTSQTLDVAFNAPDGGVSSVMQRSNVRYVDGQRSAAANEATYTPGDENLVLTGSPRWMEAGGVTTARVLKLNRQTGDAFAEGDVKTTYRDSKPPSGGALLGGTEPIHVTAASMMASRNSDSATYSGSAGSGSARLWQGDNIVEAPVIEFDRTQRVLKARGNQQPVLTVLQQSSGKSSQSTVTVKSSSMSYYDLERRAIFQGSVLLKSTDGTISSDTAYVKLQPKSESQAKTSAQANQIEEIVAQGHVVVEQPSRRAVGNTMTYTAADEKYVVTGGFPSIFDAEHGITRGDSLTFFSRSDTVLVGSETPARTVTHTHTGK